MTKKKTEAAPATTEAKQPVALETRVVAIAELRPNPWNPNKQSDFIFERERESIKEFGFVDPVTVRRVPGQEGYEIVDGEHRYRAAKEEGYTSISIVDLGEIPDSHAKRLTVVLNETRGEPDTTLMADLIKSLSDESVDLLAVLPYSEQELKRYLDIANFDLSTLEMPDTPVTPVDTSGVDVEQQGPEVKLKITTRSSGMGIIQSAISIARRLGAPTDSDALIAICKDYLEKMAPEKLA